MLNTVQYLTQSHTVKHCATPNVESPPIEERLLLPIPRLTDLEIEVQRGKGTCPKQHSKRDTKLGTRMLVFPQRPLSLNSS